MKKNIRNLLILASLLIISPTLMAQKSNCLVIMNKPDSIHSNLPNEISNKFKSNEINPKVIYTNDLENLKTYSEVSNYIQKEINIIKYNNNLPTGIMGIGAIGGSMAMSSASSADNIDYLILYSSLGKDGKEYLLDLSMNNTYLYPGGEDGKKLRTMLSESMEKLASESELYNNDILSTVCNDRNLKRLAGFQIDNTIKGIKCPVIITQSQFDTFVDWESNLTNLDKILRKEGKDYNCLILAPVDHNFEKCEAKIPNFVSPSRSKNYIPNYELNIIDMISDSIKNKIPKS